MADTKIHPGVIIGGAAAAILGIVLLSRRAKGEEEEGEGIPQSEVDEWLSAIAGATTLGELAVVRAGFEARYPPMTDTQYRLIFAAYVARSDELSHLPTTATLIITAEPSGYGFRVYIDGPDGHLLGTTPLTRTIVNPGEYTITFEDWVGMPYRTPDPVTITIVAGETKTVVGVYTRVLGVVSLLECYWWMPPNKLSTISVLQTIGGLPSLYVKLKNTSEGWQSYSILVYFGQTEVVGFWDFFNTYFMDPGAEWFGYVPITLSQSTPVGSYPVVLKIITGVPGQEGYTEVATLNTGVSIQVTAGAAPPPPPPPSEETVALQLASCAGVISGVGVAAGYSVFCLRNGYWLAYDQIGPIRVDDIGYFLTGDVVYLYLTSPCTLTYNGRSWTLVGGWNEFTW